MMNENEEYTGDPFEDDEEASPEDITAESGSADAEIANPIDVQKYLEGVEYPAARQDLLEKASGNAAPDEVMTSLENIEDTTYESPADVSAAIGKESK